MPADCAATGAVSADCAATGAVFADCAAAPAVVVLVVVTGNKGRTPVLLRGWVLLLTGGYREFPIQPVCHHVTLALGKK